MNLGAEFKAEIIRLLRSSGQLTVPQLAAATGQSLPRVAWCIKVLKSIGVVVAEKTEKRGYRASWTLTGKPLPPKYTSRKTNHEIEHGYDHRALTAACIKLSTTPTLAT